ncbi:MAG: 3-oxoacyl-ACP reductase FabG [Clostridia bacterium]|nr:3-oxoacyl-ACP reductase FabG [Clostridia bacterium]
MKNAVITGAAGGIGAAVAEKLSSDGFRVFVCYNTSKERALHLGAELLCCHAAHLDVTNPREIEALFARIEREYGAIDVLVNNAGIAQQKLFTDITDEDWEKMIAVNLSGVFYCCRAALGSMIRQKYGRIINISSMWGQSGGSCEVHYSAAKAGVIGLTKALAKETALSGVTVNCVSPGVIDTPMMSPFSAADIDALCEEIPMGRLGTPAETAAAVAFLASETASYVTGQVLGVNGGLL